MKIKNIAYNGFNISASLKKNIDLHEINLRRLNDEHFNSVEIAKALQLSDTTVMNYLKLIGLQLNNKTKRGRKIDKHNWNTIIPDLVARGMNQTQIARELNVSQPLISRWKKTI